MKYKFEEDFQNDKYETRFQWVVIIGSFILMCLSWKNSWLVKVGFFLLTIGGLWYKSFM